MVIHSAWSAASVTILAPTRSSPQPGAPISIYTGTALACVESVARECVTSSAAVVVVVVVVVVVKEDVLFLNAMATSASLRERKGKERERARAREREVKRERMFSMSIFIVNFGQGKPVPGLDQVYSDFRRSEVKQVPVIRVFGTTPEG